jgi:hypothetical protein
MIFFKLKPKDYLQSTYAAARRTSAGFFVCGFSKAALPALDF